MSPEEYLDRTRDLLPALRERAPHIEHLRRLPDETWQAFQNPIQRAWRDVHAIRAHAGNNPDKAALIFGRSEFGLPPQELRF